MYGTVEWIEPISIVFSVANFNELTSKAAALIPILAHNSVRCLCHQVHSGKKPASAPPSLHFFNMANMLRVGFLSRFSARAVGRRIHTSAPRKFDPVPIARQEAGTELQALLTKEKGPWNQLSKDEKLSCEFILYSLVSLVDVSVHMH